jgi:hypothetical protein
LIGEFEHTSGRELPSSLRVWLLRALQLEGKPFESARDAQNGLGELEGAGSAALFPIVDPEPELDPAPVAHSARVLPEPGLLPPLSAMTARRDDDSDGESDGEPDRTGGHPQRPVVEPAPLGSGMCSHRDVAAADLLKSSRAEPSRHERVGADWRGWALAALIVLAVGQAGYIGYLVSFQPPSITIAAPELHNVNAYARAADADATVWQAMSLPSAAAALSAQPPTVLERPAAEVRSGGLRLISRIEMQLLDGERVLGSSTDGPIVTSAGRHEFELVNSALGYRSRQVFDIKAGQILSVPIRQPQGQVSINAVPWADIWIDGAHIGETPLANLSLPIGQHEVSFRHPSLAEQRRTTVVRYDVPTRLSADLR